MNAYVSDHFAAALVYQGLLSSVRHFAVNAASEKRQEPIVSTFRTLEYIFKFIIQSRLLFTRNTNDATFEENFREMLQDVFDSFRNMLKLKYDFMTKSQMAFLMSISAVLEQLVAVLPVQEVAKLTCSLLDAVPTDAHPSVLQTKLEAISKLVTSEVLLKDSESRNILLVTICAHLRLHLSRREELKSVTTILGDILMFLYKRKNTMKVDNCIQRDVETICLSVFDVLIQTIMLVIETPSPVLPCLVACFMGMLQLFDEYHYRKLWDKLKEKKALKDFLFRMFVTLKDLVMREIFAPDWLVIRMQVNNIILKSIEELSKPLVFA